MDFDDDDLNSYQSMSDGYEGEDWDANGFSVDDATENQGNDAADDWLAENDVESPNPEMGMATAGNLLLGRLEPLSNSINETFKKALEGTLPPSHGYDANEIRDAVLGFTFQAGESAEALAKRINVVPQEPIKHLKRQGKDLTYEKNIVPSASRSDMNVVMSMLGKTSGSYLAEGPGLKVAGNDVQNEERRRTREDNLEKAYGHIDSIAEYYIRDATKGTKAYNNRKAMVTESLTSRFLDMHFFEPNEYGPDKGLLPLPNDVYIGEKRVTGLVPTISNFGLSTTETKITASYLADSLSDEALGKVMPNLRKSLFKQPANLSDREKALFRKDTQEQLDELREQAEFVRKTFKKEFPTLRDESLSQGRNKAFDTPYGDQAERASLRNEGHVFDIDQTRPDLNYNKAKNGRGNYKGDAYGEKGMSDMDKFIEERMEGAGDSILPLDDSRPDTDLGRYRNWVNTTLPATQGTPQWLKDRSGLVTASTADDLLRANGKIAAKLYADRNGVKDDFTGNSYTKDGTDAEAGIIASFRGGPGRGKIVEEGFLEPGQDELQGIAGVTPDGRVFTPDGTSDGLLEVKYLTNKSMIKARKTYEAQMQMQMLVTGEKQVHFYRKSSDDDHVEYDVVKADPKMQARLKYEAIQADIDSATVTTGDLDAMRSTMDNATMKAEPSSLAGPEAEYVPKVKAKAEPFIMTTYDPTRGIGAGSVRQANPAGGTLFGQVLQQREDAANKKAAQKAVDELGGVVPSGKFDSHVNAFNAVEEASQEAAKKLDKFSDGLTNAVKKIASAAGMLKGANEGAMDTVRLGAEVGLDPSKVRHMEQMLEQNGLSPAGAKQTIAEAGGQVKLFNDAETAAGEYTRMLSRRGKSDLPGIRSLEVPSIQELQGLDTQEYAQLAEDRMKNLSPEERRVAGEIFGLSKISVSDGRESLMGDNAIFKEQGQRDANEVIRMAEQAKQTGMEATTGFGGTAAGVGVSATLIGGSLAGAGLTYKGLKSLKGINKETLVSKAKGAGSLAKAGAGGLAGLAPMALRYGMEVEDDNSNADRALDVADWASWGAMGGAVAGSIFPGPGTLAGGAIGGAVGGTIGLINEFHEYVNEGNIEPPSEIGPMTSGYKKEATQPVINNVEVQVSVDKNLVTTETDVNGDLSRDEETTFGTGDY